MGNLVGLSNAFSKFGSFLGSVLVLLNIFSILDSNFDELGMSPRAGFTLSAWVTCDKNLSRGRLSSDAISCVVLIDPALARVLLAVALAVVDLRAAL